MPNYCNNKLYIKGPKHTLHKVLTAHIDNDGNFDFNTVIPYPQKYKDLDNIPVDLDMEAYTQYILTKLKEHNLEELQSKITPEKYILYKQGYDCGFGYNNGGYEWCCDNWGTKWNAINTKVYAIKDNVLIIDYDTAYSPPLPVTQGLSYLYIDLKIKHTFAGEYSEFCGHLIIKAGKVIEYIHDIDYLAEEEINNRQKLYRCDTHWHNEDLNISTSDNCPKSKKALIMNNAVVPDLAQRGYNPIKGGNNK